MNTIAAEANELWERVKRAWAHFTAWVRSKLPGSVARPYRHANEQANHAAQLADTKAAIAGMEATATAGATPEQQFFLNQHRVGMENRLSVMEGKPRLTLEELNERDAIETHLYGAPLQRIGALSSPVQGFAGLGGLAAGLPWLGILTSPLSWIAIGLAAFGVQTARINHLHHDLADAQGAARQNAQAAHTWEERSHAYEQATVDAQAAAHMTTQTLEAERRRVTAAAAREQRRQREIENVNAGADPPNWDSSLRGDPAAADQPGAATPAANSNTSRVRPGAG